jgi:hypothetical protein
LIHQHDIQALTDLLRRTPMSVAESLYANGLIQRLALLTEQSAPEPAPNELADEGAADKEAVVAPRAEPLRPDPLTGY